MFKISLLFFFFIILLSPLNAHPPTGITAAYEAGSGLLTIRAPHPVGDPVSHYVRSITVREGGQELVRQNFSAQRDKAEQLTKFFLPSLPTPVTLEVETICNKFGTRKEQITITEKKPREEKQ